MHRAYRFIIRRPIALESHLSDVCENIFIHLTEPEIDEHQSDVRHFGTLGLSFSNGMGRPEYPTKIGVQHLGCITNKGAAAGAIIYVIRHEIMPETHWRDHQDTATIELMIGLDLMLF